jgi:hypothetical protein
MSALFQKLNLKDQTEILVINPPEGFEAQIQMLKNVAVKYSGGEVKSIAFALAFVTKQKEVDALAKAFAKKAPGDAVLWFAYPKGSSKKYTCEFNRDSGWALLGEFGFEPVRQVAIDEDWSALRFRRVEFIKTLTRSFAISEQGKARTSKPNAKRKKS